MGRGLKAALDSGAVLSPSLPGISRTVVSRSGRSRGGRLNRRQPEEAAVSVGAGAVVAVGIVAVGAGGVVGVGATVSVGTGVGTGVHVELGVALGTGVDVDVGSGVAGVCVSVGDGGVGVAEGAIVAVGAVGCVGVDDGASVGVAEGRGVGGRGGTYSACPRYMAFVLRQLARRRASMDTLKRPASAYRVSPGWT